MRNGQLAAESVDEGKSAITARGSMLRGDSGGERRSQPALLYGRTAGDRSIKRSTRRAVFNAVIVRQIQARSASQKPPLIPARLEPRICSGRHSCVGLL